MQNPQASEVFEALAVTAELCGFPVSEAAARILAEELSSYGTKEILGALKRCRSELTGRLTAAAIISRIDDGRPGPNEAWAIVYGSRDEARSFAMTQEMAEARGAIAELLEDPIAARVAFLEVYTRIVARNRATRMPPEWFVSLGYDANHRAEVLAAAAEAGQISREHAMRVAPTQHHATLAARLGEPARLPNPEKAREVLALASAAAREKTV